MRADIRIFELLKKTGFYEEAKKKAIEVIKSNPTVIYELDVYGGVIDEKVAELLASIVYQSNQHTDRVQIKGLLKKNESKLIVKEYARLCKKGESTTLKDIFSKES